MPTYASGNVMKRTILTANSIIFIMGIYILTQGSIQLIGITGIPNPSGMEVKEGSDLPITYYHDRFPSVGSAKVIVIFGILIMGTSGLGITAITLDDPALLDAFGYMAFIACFIKFLFVFGSVQMHAFNYNYDPILSFKPVVLSICISIMEMVLGMCGCHLAKVLKRGDAADPKILPFPSPRRSVSQA